MNVSVIIPTYNDARNLERCITALLNSDTRDFELIVVDDASTDDTASTVARFPCKYIKLRRNGGPARARNAGAAIARGDLLVFIDSNVIVKKDTLSRIIAHYREDPSLQLLQGIASKKPVNKGFGPELFALKWYHQLHDVKNPTFVYSHVFSIKKEVFDRLDGFNEQFRPPGFGEEFELGARLRRHGIPIVVDPDIQVDHAFSGFIARTRSLYHRARNYGRVLAVTRRLEVTNASAAEVLSGCVALFFFLALASLVPTWFLAAYLPAPWFASMLALVVSCIAYLALNARFLHFILKEKGVGFAIASIIALMTWSAIEVLGGLSYFLERFVFMNSRFNPLKGLMFRFSKLPSHLVLFVTAGCNARCAHCFYWKEIQERDPGRELTVEDVYLLSRHYPALKMLTITGGEPFLRDDLVPIIGAFYHNSGLEHVTLHTNGSLPLKIKKVIRRLLFAMPELEINLSISIDGPREIHDGMRGVEGLHDRAMETLSILQEARERHERLHLTVNACFTTRNKEGILKLANELAGMGLIDGFYVSLVRGDSRDPACSEVSLAEYHDVVSRVNALRRRHLGYRDYFLSSFRVAIDDLAPEDVIFAAKNGYTRYRCPAGKTVIVVSETGEVYPCEMLGESFGNIREYQHDIARILATGKARELLARIKEGACACTWECAVMGALVFRWKAFTRVLLRALKNFISR